MHQGQCAFSYTSLLLLPRLRVMGHRQHDSPIPGQWNERYTAGGSPDAPGERS
jgi:hypothetical protein